MTITNISTVDVTQNIKYLYYLFKYFLLYSIRILQAVIPVPVLQYTVYCVQYLLTVSIKQVLLYCIRISEWSTVFEYTTSTIYIFLNQTIQIPWLCLFVVGGGGGGVCGGGVGPYSYSIRIRSTTVFFSWIFECCKYYDWFLLNNSHNICEFP